MTALSWGRIGTAVERYAAKGYTAIDTPWIVSREAMNITKPSSARSLECQFEGDGAGAAGDLVASAEQGFLQKIVDGTLPEGRYVSCGPCFRDEIEDEIHRLYFMKVELADFTARPIDISLMMMINDALDVAKNLLKENGVLDENAVSLVNTPAGYDLFVAGLEIGSYGIRSLPPAIQSKNSGLALIYGTGLAEPRFGQAIERCKARAFA